MTYDDFKTWMDSAQVAFPSLKQWLGGQSVDDRKSTWKLWRNTINNVSLDSAMAALDKVLANPKLQPYGGKWEQFPGTILGLCSSSSVQPKGRKECICNGTGIVLVGVKYRAKTFDGEPLRLIQINGETYCGPIGAACLCDVGIWINACREKKFDPNTGPKLLPKYDIKTMSVWHGTDMIFKPAIEERDRAMMSQAFMDFDGISIDPSSLQF